MINQVATYLGHRKAGVTFALLRGSNQMIGNFKKLFFALTKLLLLQIGTEFITSYLGMSLYVFAFVTFTDKMSLVKMERRVRRNQQRKVIRGRRLNAFKTPCWASWKGGMRGN